MNKLEAYGHIAALAIRGDLVFPTSVNAALRVQLALDDPDCPIDEAIRLVLAEPQLAARTVALSNSAMFNRTSTEVVNVRSAIMRIGYHNLFALAAAMVVRQFGSKIVDPELRAKAEQLWQHTVHVACLARIIAREVTGTNPDTALFASIVHEVGNFYILSRADEFPGLLEDDPDNWQPASEEIITREVLNKLNIPEAVSNAIQNLRDGFLQIPPETLLDTLLLANQLSPVDSPMQAPPRDLPPHAESVVDLFIDEEMLERILAESERDAAAMNAALLV
ncbi:HDOD domain-containing protein [Pseudoduganella namucuonensis]|uniref:HD-like signal output (HDOD) domain, no enzymatic activity n=1 Tax=Pseudoduganella namucuonensis TaxID=1035707 RepID=A0A1I7GVY9_9BURK|nr:HDOD domain-containing protein [Pseudoduganella namucuonensis]SFU52608.1 HD-like signal output (HDOD) domain, no enzymatic activity [Pseudoduganella namucuonensis]